VIRGVWIAAPGSGVGPLIIGAAKIERL